MGFGELWVSGYWLCGIDGDGDGVLNLGRCCRFGERRGMRDEMVVSGLPWLIYGEGRPSRGWKVLMVVLESDKVGGDGVGRWRRDPREDGRGSKVSVGDGDGCKTKQKENKMKIKI